MTNILKTPGAVPVPNEATLRQIQLTTLGAQRMNTAPVGAREGVVNDIRSLVATHMVSVEMPPQSQPIESSIPTAADINGTSQH